MQALVGSLERSSSSSSSSSGVSYGCSHPQKIQNPEALRPVTIVFPHVPGSVGLQQRVTVLVRTNYYSEVPSFIKIRSVSPNGEEIKLCPKKKKDHEFVLKTMNDNMFIGGASADITFYCKGVTVMGFGGCVSKCPSQVKINIQLFYPSGYHQVLDSSPFLVWGNRRAKVKSPEETGSTLGMGNGGMIFEIINMNSLGMPYWTDEKRSNKSKGTTASCQEANGKALVSSNFSSYDPEKKKSKFVVTKNSIKTEKCKLTIHNHCQADGVAAGEGGVGTDTSNEECSGTEGKTNESLEKLENTTTHTIYPTDSPSNTSSTQDEESSPPHRSSPLPPPPPTEQLTTSPQQIMKKMKIHNLLN